MARRSFCILNIHAPKRSKARLDGELFHAPCRGCGRPMIKDEDRWKALPLAEGATASSIDARSMIVAVAVFLLLAVVLGLAIAPRHVEMQEHQTALGSPMTRGSSV